MSSKPSEVMIQVLGKIPLFKGLAPSHVRQVLSMCEHQVLKEDEMLCGEEDSIEGMFMLVAGELSRLGKDGEPLESILPISAIGEVEIMTGKPLKGAIRASKPSHVFSISRVRCENMMRGDLEVQVKLLRNLSDILVGKISGEEQDAQLSEQREVKLKFEARISALERQVRQLGQRFEVALVIVASRKKSRPNICGKGF